MTKKHFLISAPGRTEISGNHTDHQRGCVLAAAVNLETVADVMLNGSNNIRVRSEGFPEVVVELDDLNIREEEKNTSAALVRGVAAAFEQLGARIKGFDAETHSTVLPGSGLSSSAAFEVLMGTICNELFFDRKLSPVEIAQIGQYAENVYFGKPSGLMDQAASSVGGMVYIDFADPDHPQVERIEFDFEKAGHALCIIDSGADHADLTDEYAAIPRELKEICNFFGKDVLREVREKEFMEALPNLRGKVSDRAILRAIHFYQENKRVMEQKKALLEKYKSLDMTLCFHVAPQDVDRDISALYSVFGDRKACAVREITKLHEEALPFTLKEGLAGEKRGEYVILIEGAKEVENVQVFYRALNI